MPTTTTMLTTTGVSITYSSMKNMKIQWMLQVLVVLIVTSSVQAQTQLFEYTDGSEAGDAALSWYLQPFLCMGIKCYPASIMLVVLAVAGLMVGVGTRDRVSMATVAHILVADDPRKPPKGEKGSTYQTLVELRDEIENEGVDELGRKFVLAAATYSQCPSKNRFGNLGTFSPNTTMAREFDEAVFNPDQDEGQCVTLSSILSLLQLHYLVVYYVLCLV
jgi:hypothetical protein